MAGRRAVLMVRWEFPVGEWDFIATWDGDILDVKCDEVSVGYAKYVDGWGDYLKHDESYFQTVPDLRTYAPTIEIARRELRAFGACRIDLDQTEKVL